MEILKGNFKQFSVLDLLALLVRAKHSGRLSLKTDKGEGYVFIEDGEIYAAKFRDKEGYEALFSLAKIDEGSFNFQDRLKTNERHFYEETAELLKHIKEDFHTLVSMESKLDKVLILIPIEKSVVLKPKEWMVVALSQKQLAIREIAKQLNLAPIEVAKIVQTLEDRGLVKLGVKETSGGIKKDQPQITPPLFWKALKAELAAIMGPIAEVVIEDEIANMDQTKEKFPYSKVPALIDVLSQEIDNHEKRINFQKKMLEIFKQV